MMHTHWCSQGSFPYEALVAYQRCVGNPTINCEMEALRDSKIIKYPGAVMEHRRCLHTTCPDGTAVGAGSRPPPWPPWSMERLYGRRSSRGQPQAGRLARSWGQPTGVPHQPHRATSQAHGAPGSPTSVRWEGTCCRTAEQRPDARGPATAGPHRRSAASIGAASGDARGRGPDG
jgi:hypothetical protein